MVQLGGFVGRHLGASLKTGFAFMVNVLKSLAKKINGRASAIDAAIQKKILTRGRQH